VFPDSTPEPDPHLQRHHPPPATPPLLRSAITASILGPRVRTRTIHMAQIPRLPRRNELPTPSTPNTALRHKRSQISGGGKLLFKAWGRRGSKEYAHEIQSVALGIRERAEGKPKSSAASLVRMTRDVITTPTVTPPRSARSIIRRVPAVCAMWMHTVRDQDLDRSEARCRRCVCLGSRQRDQVLRLRRVLQARLRLARPATGS
jgi:hypothetical protein